MAPLQYGNTIIEHTEYIVQYTALLYNEWVLRLDGKTSPTRAIPDIRMPYPLALECEHLAIAAAEAHRCVRESQQLNLLGHADSGIVQMEWSAKDLAADLSPRVSGTNYKVEKNLLRNYRPLSKKLLPVQRSCTVVDRDGIVLMVYLRDAITERQQVCPANSCGIE